MSHPNRKRASVVGIIPKIERLLNIDIKSGSDLKSINIKSHGKIPIAILLMPGFYAPDRINPQSLTFGRTGDEESLAFCNIEGEDVNGDGIKDLVCHFHTQYTEFQCGDTEGTLKGKVSQGGFIIGTGSARIIPCK